MSKAIEARDLRKVYWDAGRELEIFRSISLSASYGESLAILGPSGSGKTTLLNVLSGLDRPDQGDVWIGGRKLADLDDNARSGIRSREIGLVFQAYHLLPELTALENVTLPSRIGGARLHDAEGRGKQLLERVGLADRNDHFPNQLSGGEQQRAAIARALMNDPKILMCDEPTGNLDLETGRGIWELLKDLSRKDSKTLLVVTHDERFARIADRVWNILKKG